MPLPPDYHMHTPLCRHATGTPSEYAAAALAAGLTEIGFSDHSPMAQDDFDNWRMRSAELDEYVEQVGRARQEHPSLTIKLALEVDYIPGHEDWIRDLWQRHPWDYFIGSVHYVGASWDIDNPAKLAEWARRDVCSVWSDYFDLLARAADSGMFQIIGHADLPKKFGHRPDRDCTKLYDRFLRAAKARGAAIEINTAGLRKDCREMYPSPYILHLASRLGVSLTLGSDAHRPAEVAADFGDAVALALRCGFTHGCRFTRGRSAFVRLDS